MEAETALVISLLALGVIRAVSFLLFQAKRLIQGKIDLRSWLTAFTQACGQSTAAWDDVLRERVLTRMIMSSRTIVESGSFIGDVMVLINALIFVRGVADFETVSMKDFISSGFPLNSGIAFWMTLWTVRPSLATPRFLAVGQFTFYTFAAARMWTSDTAEDILMNSLRTNPVRTAVFFSVGQTCGLVSSGMDVSYTLFTLVLAWRLLPGNLLGSFVFSEIMYVALVHIMVSGAWVIRVAEVRSVLESKEARNLSTAGAALLAASCDAVVQLTSNLTIANPVPKLSALLLRGSQDLQGTSFLELLGSDEARTAFKEHIGTSHGVHFAQTFNTSLKDCNASAVLVNVLYARGMDANDDEFHIIGIQERSPDCRAAAEAEEVSASNSLSLSFMKANIIGKPQCSEDADGTCSDCTSSSPSLVYMSPDNEKEDQFDDKEDEEPCVSYDAAGNIISMNEHFTRLMTPNSTHASEDEEGAAKAKDLTRLKSLFVDKFAYREFLSWHSQIVEEARQATGSRALPSHCLAESEQEYPPVVMYAPKEAYTNHRQKFRMVQVSLIIDIAFAAENVFTANIIRMRKYKPAGSGTHRSVAAQSLSSRSEASRHAAMVAL